MTDFHALKFRLEKAIVEAQQASDAVNAVLTAGGYVPPGAVGVTRAALRELLRSHKDGLSIPEILSLLNLKNGQVRPALRRMPEAYIDHWRPYHKARGYRFLSIWCYCETPQEDCPKPLSSPTTVLPSKPPRRLYD